MSLPTLSEQARRLVDLGVPGATDEAVSLVDDWPDRAEFDDALLVVHPSVAPASALAPWTSAIFVGKPTALRCIATRSARPRSWSRRSALLPTRAHPAHADGSSDAAHSSPAVPAVQTHIDRTG